MSRTVRFRINPTCHDEPSVVRHALSFFARFQPHPFVRMGAPMLDHIVGPHTVQMLSVVRQHFENQVDTDVTSGDRFPRQFNHFIDSQSGRSRNIPRNYLHRTDAGSPSGGPSAACPVAMVRIGAAGLRAGNDLALLSASPVRARAREVMTYRTAYALQFQPSASSAIIGIDVGRQQHIARAANPVHKIMSSARTRTHLPVAPSPFRVIGIAFEHHPIGAQMERRDGPRRIDTQRLSPIARNQADRNPLAVAVQIGRNIPPRGFGQNLQPAEPLVQTIKRQFRQIFDRPLARPVGYECSDKKAFFLVCMSTQTSMTKKL